LNRIESIGIGDLTHRSGAPSTECQRKAHQPTAAMAAIYRRTYLSNPFINRERKEKEQ
jgi:hypothetical protein